MRSNRETLGAATTSHLGHKDLILKAFLPSRRVLSHPRSMCTKVFTSISTSRILPTIIKMHISQVTKIRTVSSAYARIVNWMYLIRSHFLKIFNRLRIDATIRKVMEVVLQIQMRKEEFSKIRTRKILLIKESVNPMCLCKISKRQPREKIWVKVRNLWHHKS